MEKQPTFEERSHRQPQRGPDTPPEEIEELTRKIREGWSDWIRDRRRKKNHTKETK